MLACSNGHQETPCKCFNAVDLLPACVEDRDNSAVWSAFLKIIIPKLRHFIRGFLCRAGHGSPDFCSFLRLAGEEEDDLIQTTMVRLVENDFALLRRFKGKSENDLLAYLAIISRSVVRDCWRRQHARKRSGLVKSNLTETCSSTLMSRERPDRVSTEFRILVREVESLAKRALNAANGFSARDRLIYKLHFLDGLSAAQIAENSGLSLSKPGIEKVYCRVMNWTRKMAGAGPARVA
jgi:RNA polymerase sigma factor (sigma-70 family)